MTNLCLRCNAPSDDGDWCASCAGAIKAEAWRGRDVIEAFKQHLGPVPRRPDDGEPGDDEPQEAA